MKIYYWIYDKIRIFLLFNLLQHQSSFAEDPILIYWRYAFFWKSSRSYLQISDFESLIEKLGILWKVSAFDDAIMINENCLVG